MDGFSTVDGFVEITEILAEMIKYLANEPSVGLFYIQQHAHNAAPNIIALNNTISSKSCATTFQTQDLEDSVSTIRCMKQCGIPIVNDMIRNMKTSIVLISNKHHPKRRSMERREPWGWGFADGEKGSGYFSNVLSSAKERVGGLKWPQFDSKEWTRPVDDNFLGLGVEKQGLVARDGANEEVGVDGSSMSAKLWSESDSYNEFRADKEAKVIEWLEERSMVESMSSSHVK